MFNSGTEQALRETIAAQQATIALLEKQYDKLFDAYHALRTAGANAVAAGLPAVLQRKPADEAIETVVARFHGHSGLRRQLQRFVLRERSLEGYDATREQDSADAVLNWRDPDTDEDDAAA